MKIYWQHYNAIKGIILNLNGLYILQMIICLEDGINQSHHLPIKNNNSDLNTVNCQIL